MSVQTSLCTTETLRKHGVCTYFDDKRVSSILVKMLGSDTILYQLFPYPHAKLTMETSGETP
jgi:hypothetical protein